ncbi:DUF1592 domain-containing protein [Rhodopirellula sp. JC639]|uniref:DUF1592 domain-containing protein n=1 Tax=Stieleria mannarensis TaxID=2755585 RepID=UPI0015FF5C8B|nr:DUF1592 domain-containing protein [Rhodopirellula sp. JC639]
MTCILLRFHSAAWLSILLLATLTLSGQAADSLETATEAPRSFQQARAIGLQRSKLLGRHPTPVATDAKPNLDEFARTIGPILAQACADCHGADTQEGNVRIDTLNPDLINGNDMDWWLEVQAVVSNNEMPPPGEGELSDADRAKVVQWLSNEIQVASIVRRASGEHHSFRRMTRYEFNHALQDLLGLPYDFAKDLPPEAHSEEGFQNSSELLHMSVSQFESYRRLARQALLRATVRGERPPMLHWGVTMNEAGRIDWAKQQQQIDKAKAENADDPEAQQQQLQKLEQGFRQRHNVPYFKDLSNGRTVRVSWQYRKATYAHKPAASPPPIPESADQIAILPRGRNNRFRIELGNRVPDEGTLRVRVRAACENADEASPPSLKLLFGWQASNEGRALLPVGRADTPITAPPDAPKFYQWDVPLGEIYPRNSVRKTSPLGAMPNPSEYIAFVNSSVSQGPIRIDYVEVTAPVYPQWPPKSHTRIFFDSPHRDDETVYAREVLTGFIERVWGPAIAQNEIDRKLELFATMRPQCDSFEEAMVEVLATVLASPRFLYIVQDGDDDVEGRAPLTGPELATRLSMFLWCSIPDERLHRLAADDTLLESEVLQHEITRMLADDRAKRLSQHFVHGWLDMQLLDFLNVPRAVEPLKESMQREPIELFHEMVRNDASVIDFLHADYTMADERLAVHYGLSDVKGNHFRRVDLNPAGRRGGLLTQAGLLAMNSAGEDSHPLKRGVWLLECLLNDPPPPPPPAVPEIDLADPEIAKMTLKEQIEDHRNHAACMSCHAKIDPWGIAFENYDALGRWRDSIGGKPVDATSTLFNEQELDGMDGLKRFLLEQRQDQFVRSLVHKLTTYGLGRSLTFADRAGVDEITAQVRRQGDGLATMIRLIATSELFRTK